MNFEHFLNIIEKCEVSYGAIDYSIFKNIFGRQREQQRKYFV